MAKEKEKKRKETKKQRETETLNEIILTFSGKYRADMDRGAFGEYVLTPADTTIMNIPDNITFEEAATLGVSLTTVVSFQNLIYINIWREREKRNPHSIY